MINVSAEWQRSVALDNNRQYIGYADIMTTKGEKISTDSSNYWQGGFKISDSTSEEEAFSLGSLVSAKLTIILNNIYNDYDKYDFNGAQVRAYIGKKLESGTEKVRVGDYIVTETSYNGATITLTCLDNIHKFNKLYDEPAELYPTTVYEIVRNACHVCGVPFSMARFDNSDIVIETAPSNQYTYGQVVTFVLQLTGNWGRCNNEGRLIIDWYDMTQFDADKYDGGTLKGNDGANLNGGTFSDYNSGDSADGGALADAKKYHILSSMSDINIATDDVVITGVRLSKTSSVDEEEDYNYLAGAEGYVISVANNELINKKNCENIAKKLYAKIGGMRFRPMRGSFSPDPTVEAGDIAVLYDRKGNEYNVYISNRTFSLGDDMNLSCDAQTPARNTADKFSEATKNILDERKTLTKKLNAYDKGIQALTQLMSQSFGLFKTTIESEDGSVVYIMHNKKDIESSAIQWKMTADGMAVSSDYGRTWNAGVDKDGNAVYNIMSAIGINFDWAHGGTLTLGGDKNTSGKLLLKDAQGNVLITLDNEGIKLSNKAKIDWNNISNQPSIPQNTSDLINDSDFATTGDIPTKNSQLENDSNFTTMTEVERKNYTTMTEVERKNYTTMQAVLDKKYQNSDQVTTITKNTVTSAFISTLGLLVGKEIQMGENATISWKNVTNQPSIPQNTSDLINDSDFASEGYVTDYVEQNATAPLNNLISGIKYTEIDGQKIISPRIRAGVIQSCAVSASRFQGCSYFAEGRLDYKQEDYSQSDVDRANKIILKQVIPDMDDYIKLDINGDGKITIKDIALINNIINDGDRFTTRYVSIDPSRGCSIALYEGSQITTYIAPKGINTQNVTTDTISSYGVVDMYAPSDSSNLLFSVAGNGISVKNMTATGSTITSDARLKENIKEIPHEYLEAVSDVGLIQYNYIKDIDDETKNNFGILAQDLLESLNSHGCEDSLGIVTTHTRGDNATEYYGVDYIQFLLLRLASAEERIRKLEEEIEKREER